MTPLCHFSYILPCHKALLWRKVKQPLKSSKYVSTFYDIYVGCICNIYIDAYTMYTVNTYTMYTLYAYTNHTLNIDGECICNLYLEYIL